MAKRTVKAQKAPVAPAQSRRMFEFIANDIHNRTWVFDVGQVVGLSKFQAERFNDEPIEHVILVQFGYPDYTLYAYYHDSTLRDNVFEQLMAICGFQRPKVD